MTNPPRLPFLGSGVRRVLSFAAGAILAMFSLTPAHADPAATLLWERFPGSVDYDFGEAVATDTTGNVLVGGQTWGSIGRRDNHGADAFVIKYSPDGGILWRRQPGPGLSERLRGLATDLADNVIAVGETNGAIAGTSHGRTDGFVVKYAADGALRWRRQFGTKFDDFAVAVAADTAGNIIVVGQVDVRGPCCETGDAFVIKYAPDGTEEWRRSFDLSGLDGAAGVATNAAGDIFVAGNTASSEGPDYGAEDTFLARLSPDGTVRWIEQQETASDDGAMGVAVDEMGRIFVVGSQHLATYPQGLVAAFSGDATELWRRAFGSGLSYDGAYSVAIDAGGHVLLSGSEAGKSIVASYSREGALRWKILPERFDRGGYAFLTADGTGHMAVVGTADVRAAAGHWNAHVARYEVD